MIQSRPEKEGGGGGFGPFCSPCPWLSPQEATHEFELLHSLTQQRHRRAAHGAGGLSHDRPLPTKPRPTTNQTSPPGADCRLAVAWPSPRSAHVNLRGARGGPHRGVPPTARLGPKPDLCNYSGEEWRSTRFVGSKLVRKNRANLTHILKHFVKKSPIFMILSFSEDLCNVYDQHIFIEFSRRETEPNLPPID